jgi:NAD-dependent deacetylase
LNGAVALARQLVGRAERIVVLTGAGVSAESGVPTFRGTAGLWKSHRPEQLATPEAFARDPRTVWEWYAWRRRLVAACAPNPAHFALARLALEHAHATLVTQNVDGLHHRAAEALAAGGAEAARAYALEVHGAVHRDRCSGCARRSPPCGDVDASSAGTLPRCSSCGELLRPDVVWFGEPLDTAVLGAAFAAAQGADVCLVVGTSSVVYPAASIPEIALRAGAAVIEVNPEDTPLSPLATVIVRGSAGSALPSVLDLGPGGSPCGTPGDG